jgi:hypothetical protein
MGLSNSSFPAILAMSRTEEHFAINPTTYKKANTQEVRRVPLQMPDWDKRKERSNRSHN